MLHQDEAVGIIFAQIRDQRLLSAYQAGKNNIVSELVFPSPDGSILDPDNLHHRFFLPVLAKVESASMYAIPSVRC
jgi:hypothetical protein